MTVWITRLMLVGALIVLAGAAHLGIRFVVRDDVLRVRDERNRAIRALAVVDRAMSETETRDNSDERPVLSAVASDALAAELELQQAILSVTGQLLIDPISFGPAPVPVVVEASDDPTSRGMVAFEIEFDSGYGDVLALLAEVEGMVPPVGVGELLIRRLPPGSLGDQPTPVSVRLVAWRFWQSAG